MNQRFLDKGERLNVAVHLQASDFTVLDVDVETPGLDDIIFDEVGETTAIVVTPSGGRHFYYRGRTGCSFGVLKEGGRAKIDLLAGRRIAVLPPSSRSGVQGKRDGEYTFLRGGIPDFLSDLTDAPTITGKAVQDLARQLGRRIERDASAVQPPARGPQGPLIGAGSRSTALVDHLLCFARNAVRPGADTRQAHEILRNEASQFCARRIDRITGHEFTDRDVENVVRWVVEKVVAGENFKVESPLERMRRWMRKLEGEAEPSQLLEMLVRCHQPGSTFALCTAAMARAESMPCWPESRLKSAKRRLVTAGALVLVHKGGRGCQTAPERDPV